MYLTGVGSTFRADLSKKSAPVRPTRSLYSRGLVAGCPCSATRVPWNGTPTRDWKNDSGNQCSNSIPGRSPSNWRNCAVNAPSQGASGSVRKSAGAGFDPRVVSMARTSWRGLAVCSLPALMTAYERLLVFIGERSGTAKSLECSLEDQIFVESSAHRSLCRSTHPDRPQRALTLRSWLRTFC